MLPCLLYRCFHQSVLTSSYHDTSTLRPLCSTVVTRFFATTSLSDSRPVHVIRLCIPASRLCLLRALLCRVSQVPLPCSFHARCPLSPRSAQRLLLSVTSSLMTGFLLFGGLAASIGVNEAESGSLALRLASLLVQGTASRIAPTHARTSYLLNGQLTR